MMEWINIEDSKPEVGTFVLCFDVFKQVRMGYYENVFDQFRNILDDSVIKATHWMPLPEPPKD